jgi:hypothetical protein
MGSIFYFSSCSEEPLSEFHSTPDVIQSEETFYISSTKSENGNRNSLCGGMDDFDGCIEYNSTPYNIDILGCEYTIISTTFFACPSGIIITDVVYVEGNSPGCDSLNQQILANGGLFADQIAALISNKVQDRIMNFVVNSDLLSLMYQCGSTPCIPNTFSVSYINAGCYFRCARTVYSLPGSGQGNTIEITELECGNACCKRVTPFCIDGDNICYGDVEKTSTGDCNPLEPITCDDRISNKLGDCSHPCDRL